MPKETLLILKKLLNDKNSTVRLYSLTDIMLMMLGKPREVVPLEVVTIMERIAKAHVHANFLCGSWVS